MCETHSLKEVNCTEHETYNEGKQNKTQVQSKNGEVILSQYHRISAVVTNS